MIRPGTLAALCGVALLLLALLTVHARLIASLEARELHGKLVERAALQRRALVLELELARSWNALSADPDAAEH